MSIAAKSRCATILGDRTGNVRILVLLASCGRISIETGAEIAAHLLPVGAHSLQSHQRLFLPDQFTLVITNAFQLKLYSGVLDAAAAVYEMRQAM